ncbi:type I-E CRISPR-associated protein Cas5/CasD [Streptomyces thermoviolaceus]|uniref:type I-E CRISPR-associated protein Cas5/CasD n=1 Tax=Streptomyces thermoviolaceus TaxID=1952 RepID=UPI0033AF5641
MTTPHSHGDHRHSAGLLLHLSGPLQSWGERSRFTQRDTARFPTRSGLIGLLAAALGRRRGQPVDDLARLSLTVRVDRPGVLLRDYHTVGGGLPAKATVTTAEGGKRKAEAATLVSDRYYLADAAFTAALTSDDTALLHQCAEALRSPTWPLYLGRRSCPPTPPLLIGDRPVAQPLTHLVHLPLAAPPPRDPKDATEPIAFYSDQPLHTLAPHSHPAPASAHGGRIPTGEITDDPVDLAPHRRAYRARPLYQRTLALPAHQHAGYGADYLQALAAYLRQHVADFDQEAVTP